MSQPILAKVDFQASTVLSQTESSPPWSPNSNGSQAIQSPRSVRLSEAPFPQYSPRVLSPDLSRPMSNTTYDFRSSLSRSSTSSSSNSTKPVYKRVSGLHSQMSCTHTEMGLLDHSNTTSTVGSPRPQRYSSLFPKTSDGGHLLSDSNSKASQMAKPSVLVEKIERINPRSVADEYSLPSSVASGQQVSATSRISYNINPFSWDTMDGKPESDDYLHNPEIATAGNGWKAKSYDARLCNALAVFVLSAGLVALFAGYPIISYYTRIHESTKGGFNLGGTNGSSQIASFPGLRSGLIDPDTPKDAMTTLGVDGTTTLELVFSDEFNTDGRSFYSGHDPYWEAVDLHYWGTRDYEWYSPDAVTTRNGSLEITLDQVVTHNLNFRSGHITSWNKFCFTGGLLIASVQMPGHANVSGLWPAFWTMGNLGRAGYGATTDGTWPYSYDSCDVGTLMNQTYPNGEPRAAATGGDVVWNRKSHSKSLSFLPGQKLSACTCSGEDHPGPKLHDGSFKGRSAPEIDVFEAQVDGNLGLTVSQSMQAAPFNNLYQVTNTSGPAFDFFTQDTHLNLYNGQNTQQALSGVSLASQTAVEYGGDNSFATYGFEYQPGIDGHVQWISDGKPSWRINPAALEPDPVAEIGHRPIPNEPMYILFNLGISENFAYLDWEHLQFPVKMKIDWVRVYQQPGQVNVGCDPSDFPTADYINRHMEAYTNPNYTTWGGSPDTGGYGASWPRNRLYPDGCNAPSSTQPGSPVEPYPKASSIPTSEIAVGQSRRKRRR